MTPDAAFALEIGVVVSLAVLIVAIIVVASSGVCEPAAGAGRAAVHDIERALGDAATLVTYEQARAAWKSGGGSASADDDEEEEEAPPRCALCLSEFGSGKAGDGGELVRVVSACGHFFHAECIDGWLRKGRTCPCCRGEAWPLPRQPRPECPPMPPRPGRATVGPP